MTMAITTTVKNLVKQYQDLNKEFYKLKIAFGIEADKNATASEESIKRDQQSAADVIKACNCIKNKLLEEIEATRNKSSLSAEQLEEINQLRVKVDSLKLDEFMAQLTEHNNKLIVEADEYFNNLIASTQTNIADFDVKYKAALDEIQKRIEESKIGEERSALQFGDLKTIILNFFTECKDDFTKDLTDKVNEVKNKVSEEVKDKVNELTDKLTTEVKDKVNDVKNNISEKLTTEVKDKVENALDKLKIVQEEQNRGLPDCEINVIQRGADIKNICIGPNVTGLEMNGSILSISQQDNLVCNNGALINTIDDCDAIATIDERSKYLDEAIIGRYVEFTDYNSETNMFTVGTYHDLTNKVFAIVKDFIPTSTRTVIHKHHIINLEADKKYVVIAFTGVVPVRVKESEYNVCDVLVPNGDGLYTNNITPDRLFYVINKCIPRVKVLKTTNKKDLLVGLIC